LLLSTICAEVVNTPLNHGVVFVKHKDVVVTSDYWRIVVNFDLYAYEDATIILREDLFRFKEIAKALHSNWRTTSTGNDLSLPGE